MFKLLLKEVSGWMKSYWIVVGEVGVIQAEWCRNSIVEKEEHV